jgi:hypothetical protein
MEKLLGEANRAAGLGRLLPLARRETSRFLAAGALRRNAPRPVRHATLPRRQAEPIESENTYA